MATETDSTLAETPEAMLSAATAPVATATMQAADPALPTVGSGKNIVLPSNSLGKIKAEQRERGKREAMNELEAKFRAAGFGSLDDAIAAMATVRNGGSTQQTTAPAQKNQQQQFTTPADMNAAKNDRRAYEKAQREREAFAKRYAQEQARARRLERQLEAKEAEMALRETAVVKGVRDVDYALRLLQRELEGKDEAALSTFDEGKFFENLRSSHPYLYGETVVPATTGTGVGAAPAAPKAGTVQQAQGAAGRNDARSLSQSEFQKLLASRGLNVTGL